MILIPKFKGRQEMLWREFLTEGVRVAVQVVAHRLRFGSSRLGKQFRAVYHTTVKRSACACLPRSSPACCTEGSGPPDVSKRIQTDC